jgi:hypothetical protein
VARHITGPHEATVTAAARRPPGPPSPPW